MADEKIGITVEVKGTGAGIKSVKELKEEVKKLDETISKADFGSDEFKKATEESEKLKKKMNEISGTETAKMTTSLKALQQEYKRLKVALSEASNPNEFARLSKELNDVEGQIGDINDAASLATGSGVEQLGKSINMVKDGFMNFDFGKITAGFKGIGNAMSAFAPLLLIEGISLLIENFDKVVEVVKTMTGTFSAEEIQVKKTTKAYEEQKKVTSALVSQYENEIKILEAKGGNEEKILEVKKKKIAAQIQELKASVAVVDATMKEIAANDDLSESLGTAAAWIQRKLGNDKMADLYEQGVHFEKLERTKEQQQKKTESLQAIASLEADLVVLQITNDKKVIESSKKAAEEKKKIAEQNAKDLEEINRLAFEAQQAKDKADVDARMAAANQAVLDYEAEEKRKTEVEEFELQRRLEKDKAHREEKKKLDELDAKAKKELELQSFNAAKNLSDAVFSIQIGNAKKGSAEETKLKKQQFNINKAFAITQATIDGFRAVQTVLATYPIPINIPIAAVTGIASAANIAKIASTKFDGGAASGGGGGSSPQIGSTSLPTPPTINTPQNNTTTSFDAQGNTLRQSNQTQTIDITGKVIVSENDIREKTNRANKLITQTTI